MPGFDADPSRVEDVVADTIAAVCSVDRSLVTSQKTLGELGLDSMGVFTVLGHVESAIGLEFDAEATAALFQVHRVDQLVGLVREVVARARP